MGSGPGWRDHHSHNVAQRSLNYTQCSFIIYYKYYHFSILPALPQTAPKLFAFLSSHAKQVFSHKHACCDCNRQEKHVVWSDIKR